MADTTHTLLVVDDNAWNRDLLNRRLKRAGYAVAIAENGEEAIDKVRNENIDLVLLDVMMPGISGIDVLRMIRKTHSPAELPVIMATAKNQSEDIVEALDQGANDYVTKPLDFAVILARVQAQLRMKEASGAPRRRRRDDADSISIIAALKPGMVLSGKYKLEEELGAGSFGVVYKASHLGFQQPVAVKLLQASVEDSPEALERFRREGVSTLRLQHPNAVSVLDFGVTSGGLAYLVMELLEGCSLSRELQERGRLSPRRMGEIVEPVCDVLEVTHDMGLVHRDIKPANIFLQQTRRGEVVKVLDFGIAKLVGDAGDSSGDADDLAMRRHLTIDQTILGTPAYIAPERLCGGDYDGRADVYSLGATMYQMLAGEMMFSARDKQAVTVAMMHITQEPVPLSRHRPSIDPELDALILRTVAKEPESRPTAKELRLRLREILARDRGEGDQDTDTARSMDALELPTVQTSADHLGAESAELFGSAPPQRMVGELAFAFPELLRPPPGTLPTDHEPLPIVPGDRLGDPWATAPDISS